MRTLISAVGAVFALVMTSGCSAPTAPPPATVTVTHTTASAEAQTVAPPPAQITIPDLAGMNAEIARKNLKKLGLTDVNLASANPAYSNVILAKNWTVVSIEPPPGTVIAADDPVVVKVTKD